jgi:hypothetical protein
MSKNVSGRKSHAKAPTQIRRKNLNIDQVKLDRAVEILSARTETDAVDQALDRVLFEAELMKGIRSFTEGEPLDNYFDEDL